MSSSKTGTPGLEEKVVRGAACYDCGGRCPLRFHVRDGAIVRIEGDDAEEPDQLRTCVRCRAYRQWVYHPDRLKHPMRRVGEKGEGRFERISWEEAFTAIASEMKRVKERYGNSAILLFAGGGYQGALHNASSMARLLSLFGGYTTTYGNVSSEGCVWAVMTQYGTVYVGNSRDEFLNSRLIILWGWDPMRQIFGTNTMYYLVRAREAGAKIVVIDPRYSDSAVTLADQWIPIYPGTDTAMMAAMANVMIREGLHDRAFLDRYTVGFEHFERYVMGREDGVEKTPGWAEPICGVPAAVIERLARDYAVTKPAALMDAQGPARSAMGEQFTRGAMTLAAMTGNVGIKGGNAGGGLQVIPIGHMFRSSSIPGLKNPAEAGGPSVRGTLDLKLRLVRRIHINKVADAILQGKAGGFPADIKFGWFTTSNYVNQLGNSNKTAEALKRLEFMVVPELFMTPTARFADIVLPVKSPVEKNDITRPWPSGPYYIYVKKVIEPLGECKSDFEIARELAPYLGIDNLLFINDNDLSHLTEDDWLRGFVKTNPETAHIDYDRYKEDGIYRVKLPEPVVAFKEQIQDPENHPFPTPSGKIEIFSQRVADLNDPNCPPIPKYLPIPEGRSDPLAEKYPLQLVTPHAKVRVHSTLHNVPWLREVDPQKLWINPVDAEARGIRDGDPVMVFNDRGKSIVPAWVTQRIMPGVVCLFEGAWYSPDEDGIDRGGCPNVLTRDGYSPGGACVMHSSLVEVQKAP